MRILHVYSGNLFGGIESILVTLARTACPEVTQEFALAFDGRLARELAAAGAAVHPLGQVRISRPQTVFGARRALRGVLAAHRFDRVICHAPWTQAIFGGVVRREQIPLVFWAHDAMTGCHWTERLARRTPPDLVICNSRFTAGTLPTMYRGVPSEVIYAPVERRSLGPVGPGGPRGPRGIDEARTLRASLNTPEHATVIVQASRSEPWKGHALLLEALGRLRDVPGWVWWQVGGAQRPAEAEFLASLRVASERHGIADRVRWLGERTDVASVLAASDIYCQANLAPEPYGVVFVEALLSGLPVVTANLGGAPEIVDETCGILVAPRDGSALAAALRRLIEDAPYRASLARGTVARALRLSDPVAQLRRLRSVLDAMPQGVGA
jgi:glycosyltransferase involved in cell wall biosynthesis